MEFPDIYNQDFKEKDFEKAKQAIDFAVEHYEGQQSLRHEVSKLYDSYNGIIDPKAHESLTKPFGKRLKAKYIHHNFGLNKVKTLIGEFLSAPMDPNVETIDEEQVNKKYDKYLERKAMVDLRPQIQLAQEQGYDVFPGMVEQMDDQQEFLVPNNFKTENEIVLTKYLKNKIRKERLKLKFKQNVVDGICSCVLTGKVETVNGVDTYRRISPLNAMFLEYETEGFFEESPYLGEKRYMFKHQVIKEFDITSKNDLEKLEQWGSKPAEFLKDKSYQYKNGSLLYPVYTIEFKTVANNIYFKIDRSSDVPYIREIQEKEYDSIKKIAEKKKDNHTVEVVKIYVEEVWEISRIGTDMYKNIHRVVKQANAIENKKLRARYNYIFFGMDNVEGVRVPIQSVIAKLDNAYNDVQFLISKEIRKPSGNALGINMGFISKEAGGYKDVMTELTDDGTIRFNTAAEGNKFAMDGKSEQALVGVNVGDKGRVIDVLLRLKQDIEFSIDRITGITRGRSGAEMATTTATTSNNNLESSRTTTYDFFYQIKEFFDEVMTRMVEKGKLNMVENNPELFGGIFSDEEFNFIKASNDIPLENFTAYINDGRKELYIIDKIEALFLSDINSGQLRSKDVIRFYLADSLNQGLRVLDKAWSEINKLSQQNAQSSEQLKLQQEQERTKQLQEEREDIQAHEIEAIETQGNIDKENIQLEKSLDANIKSQDNANKMVITDKKVNADLVKSGQQAQVKKESSTSKNVKTKTKK